MLDPDWLLPHWTAPASVRSFVTTRQGGVSAGPYGLVDGTAAGLNLGLATGDDPAAVAANRARVRTLLPADPVWLRQVHGARVVDLDRAPEASGAAVLEEADASVTRRPGVVLAIQVADCMPVLFSNRAGTVVAAAHAGWRGLSQGVLEATLAALETDPGQVIAYLGPAIGRDAFEVGADVRDAFCRADAAAETAFRPKNPGKWLADLEWLARDRLARAGVTAVTAASACTVTQPERFYSFRRDRVTGRMAAFIWLERSA